MKKSTVLFLFILSCPLAISSFGQDTLRINQLIALADSINEINPSKSIEYANEAAALSLALGNQDKLQQALKITTDGYYRFNNTDSMKYYQKLRIGYAEKAKDYDHLTKVLKEYGNDLIYLYGNSPEAVKQFQKQADYHEIMKDTVGQFKALYFVGHTLHRLDDYDEAMIKLTESLYLSEQSGDLMLQGETIEMMAIIQKQLGDYEKSLQLHERSKRLFIAANNKVSLMGNYNNVGIVYKELGAYEKALESYEDLYRLAKELNNERGYMGYYSNTSTLLNLLGRHKEAIESADKAYEFSLKLEDPIAQANAKVVKANALSQLKKYDLAESEIKKALELSKNNQSLEKQQDAHQTAKEIYLAMNQPKEAVLHMEAFQVLGDSLFQIERTKQVNELQEKYESAKKDAEIIALNKDAEIASIKNKSLVAGLLSIAMIGVLTVFGLIQRHKKKQALLDKEKQVEVQRRKASEQQLEYKKKELTAKALQLAKKNEFLQSLEQEVTDIQSSVDNAVNKTSSKITRMIQRDIVDDEAWNQFGKEFSSVHQEFLNRLRELYGSFTKGEMRLISLMRMNMNSKDIASILGVSDQGVKKARYRLRKKMQLESDDDIQGIIVGL